VPREQKDSYHTFFLNSVAPMKTFLRRFAAVVLGVLSGFDRLVCKGRLPQLYSPQGMNCYASANHVRRLDFKAHAKEVTRQVLAASLVQSAKAADRFQYLGSSRASKDEVARAILQRHPVAEGLAAVLQCVEPCWTFDTHSVDGRLTIRGEPGKCSALYHYFQHPRFGWMYLRLQTWFPFEVQIGLNGREWLARRMDQEGMKYQRSDNKFLWVEDWGQAQRWLQEQQRTDWIQEFDALLRQVHPLHPGHLGRLPLAYNWTVHQSEWATDVAFASRSSLVEWYGRWVRHAFANFTSTKVLRFLGRCRRLSAGADLDVHSDVQAFADSVRLKHWVNGNSVKMYDHGNVLRVETTVNEVKEFRSYRAAVGDPEGKKQWRVLRRSVADTYRRAEVSQGCNERYLESLSGVAATATVSELVSPWCKPTTEPGDSGRQVRALNPLAAADAALLTAVSDPKWQLDGLRNRDLSEALYGAAPAEQDERKRRSAKVSRLLRLLRGHGILQKLPNAYRYRVRPESRDALLAVLAARQANADTLTANAA
jgi:hypothetical protein